MFSRTNTPENQPNPATSPTQTPAAPAAAGSGPTPAPAGTGPTQGRDPFRPAAHLTGSTIGTDLSILGEKITIISRHELHIDGDVRADINGRKVTIGQEGSVIGTITADNVEIHGGLKGAVKAKSVALQPTAKVDGDIHHQTLAIAEGAEFDGRVRRPKDESELVPNLDPNAFAKGNGSSSG